jgi:hypothetical protein
MEGITSHTHLQISVGQIPTSGYMHVQILHHLEEYPNILQCQSRKPLLPPLADNLNVGDEASRGADY